jgi:hypothetical protein
MNVYSETSQYFSFFSWLLYCNLFYCVVLYCIELNCIVFALVCSPFRLTHHYRLSWP